MKLILAAVLLLAGSVAHARIFNNPILDNADYPDPGAILFDGVYYVITTTNNNLPDKFAIHTSRDLNSWTLAGYAFNEGNIPVWFVEFLIHIIVLRRLCCGYWP